MAGLAFVLLAGLVLRAVLMGAWRPAFVGYSDSAAYLDLAREDVWASGFHPFGYPLFLRDLHALVDKIWFTVGVQHLFGVLSALLVWLMVRLAGGTRWLALLPAAVVALSGDQIFLEHSILSESLFTLLLAASLYCAARVAGTGNLGWAVLAGLLLAIANTVRVVALPLIAVLIVWLLFAGGGSWRARLRVTATAGGCVLLVLGACVVMRHHHTGDWDLAPPAGTWNLYGRVAPFADCTRFTPPAGTEALCEKTPPVQRRKTVEDYVFSPSLSPALKAFASDGGPQTVTRATNQKIARFTRAVIVHQPFDYLRTVLEGVVAYVTPVRIQFEDRTTLGSSHELFYHEVLRRPGAGEFVRKIHFPWYGGASFEQDQALLEFMLGYEARTRITGALMALLMLLSLLAPFGPRGRSRQIGTLLFLVAWTALVTPPATHWWDARYAIPPLLPVGAAAALGAAHAGRLIRTAARRGIRKWRRRDSNPRHADYDSAALTN